MIFESIRWWPLSYDFEVLKSSAQTKEIIKI